MDVSPEAPAAARWSLVWAGLGDEPRSAVEVTSALRDQGPGGPDPALVEEVLAELAEGGVLHATVGDGGQALYARHEYDV
jgi:Fe2+ or Zn2+ uptake regulation protein